MNLKHEDVMSTFRACLSGALAESLIFGFDEAEERGGSLNQKQKEGMAVAAIMTYADSLENFKDAVEISSRIRKAIH